LRRHCWRRGHLAANSPLAHSEYCITTEMASKPRKAAASSVA
jgi:hypothetical protein